MLAFTECVLQQGHGWTDELSCRTSSGECLPAEISASVIEVGGKNCIIAMVRNIAERKRLETEIIRVSEEQQKTIQELHDGLGQHLTSIAFLSMTLQQKLCTRSLPEADAKR
ncbi:MAG: hypothetical protein ACRED0_11465 [Gammaproteobacteria bacterium]